MDQDVPLSVDLDCMNREVSEVGGENGILVGRADQGRP